MTQADLADVFEVRPQTIGRWERGKRPQRRFLQRIAHFLGLPDGRAVHDLLDSDAVATVLQPSAWSDTGVVQEAELNELQREIVRGIAQRIGKSPSPTAEETEVFKRLLKSVGLD